MGVVSLCVMVVLSCLVQVKRDFAYCHFHCCWVLVLNGPFWNYYKSVLCLAKSLMLLFPVDYMEETYNETSDCTLLKLHLVL